MQYTSYQKIYNIKKKHTILYWVIGLILLMLMMLLLPWTQNIKGKGKVTTLYQEQRPQQLNSPIPGRIAKWYVKNGDFVKKGDTILKLTEIKDDYWDPKLIERAQQQVDAKKSTNFNYENKLITAQAQLQAIKSAQVLKLNQIDVKQKQLQNKLQAEEADLIAIKNELKLIEDQNNRQKKMYDEGLVSLTQFQQRTVAYQNATAKKTVAENKLAQTQQEIIANNIERNAVVQEYSEKLNKIQGDIFQNQGNIETNKGDIAKLENQVSNYVVRQGMYSVLASQDGQIIQINKSGINEIIKDGENIATIVPEKINYAVDFEIAPMDLPLIQAGQEVVFVFDGYPAIVFSGWPESSYGVFRGKVIAVENNISSNGFFKALVIEQKESRTWPKQMKMGTGVQGMAMLKDVPLFYEIWRNINGFPPDYYIVNSKQKLDAKAQ